MLAKGSQLGASHQAWQMNEINALIWPSPAGIGLLDKALYDQTIKIATTYKVLKAAPSADATRTDLAQKALDALGSSVDTKGASFARDRHAQRRAATSRFPASARRRAREGRPSLLGRARGREVRSRGVAARTDRAACPRGLAPLSDIPGSLISAPPTARSTARGLGL